MQLLIGVCCLFVKNFNQIFFSYYKINLWPSDLKIKRGHLPVMTNVPMKFRDPRPNHSWVIRKPFSYFQSLWNWPVTFDIVTSKSIGVIYQSWPMSLWSFMVPGVSFLSYPPEIIFLFPVNHFTALSLVTLTFDLVTWKSIGVICQSWPMSLWSFMIPGVSVLELSSGNHFPISSQLFYCFRSLWPWPLT